MLRRYAGHVSRPYAPTCCSSGDETARGLPRLLRACWPACCHRASAWAPPRMDEAGALATPGRRATPTPPAAVEQLQRELRQQRPGLRPPTAGRRCRPTPRRGAGALRRPRPEATWRRPCAPRGLGRGREQRCRGRAGIKSAERIRALHRGRARGRRRLGAGRRRAPRALSAPVKPAPARSSRSIVQRAVPGRTGVPFTVGRTARVPFRIQPCRAGSPRRCRLPSACWHDVGWFSPSLCALNSSRLLALVLLPRRSGPSLPALNTCTFL